MNQQEIINEISRLPFAEQQQVIATISASLQQQSETSDQEQLEQIVLERLLAKGIISETPVGWDADEDFEPVKIEGEPLSEMIIRERS